MRCGHWTGAAIQITVQSRRGAFPYSYRLAPVAGTNTSGGRADMIYLRITMTRIVIDDDPHRHEAGTLHAARLGRTPAPAIELTRSPADGGYYLGNTDRLRPRRTGMLARLREALTKQTD
jgi:hypothetical protein